MTAASSAKSRQSSSSSTSEARPPPASACRKNISTRNSGWPGPRRAIPLHDVNSKFVRMAPIIQVENVRKVYHVGKVEVPAVRGVSFSVEAGEIVAVVGPSRRGKSTLFYLL